MEIYLPIAELSANALILLVLGGGVGLLSGMFGVGGGFLMTPLLIFLGVTPSVAVGTGTNLIIASSVSGTMAHWRRGNVDFLIGALISAGGVGGAWLGAFIFKLLRDAGQIDLVVSLAYVVFLAVVGCLMAVRERERHGPPATRVPPQGPRPHLDSRSAAQDAVPALAPLR